MTECFAQGRVARAFEGAGIGCCQGRPGWPRVLKDSGFLELTAYITDRSYL